MIRGLCPAALAAIIVLPAELGAIENDHLISRYELTWSGVPIGHLSTELRREHENYRIDYQARSAGALAWFVDFESQGFSAGRLKDNAASPEIFEGRSQWSDGSNFWTVRFDERGLAHEIELPDGEVERRTSVPEELKRGPDPMSLLITAMRQAEDGKRLEGNSFDGRRALAVELNCENPEKEALPVTPEQGKLDEQIVCTIDGKLLGGARKEYADRPAREADSPPGRVWLSDEVMEGFLWPTQIEAETRFGPVRIRLVQIDRPLAKLN